MAYKISPQAWTPDDYKDVYSFTVKYKWVCDLCVWCLIKRGYPQVAVQDLKFITPKQGLNMDPKPRMPPHKYNPKKNGGKPRYGK